MAFGTYRIGTVIIYMHVTVETTVDAGWGCKEYIKTEILGLVVKPCVFYADSYVKKYYNIAINMDVFLSCGTLLFT